MVRVKDSEIQSPPYLTVSKVIAWAMYAWVFLGIILLAIRVFLLAFSANAATPFVSFIYRTSSDYLAPFRGIFPPKSIGETGYLDVAALFAIIIYLLVAWGFSSLIAYIQRKIDEDKKQQENDAAYEQLKATEQYQVRRQSSDTKPTNTQYK